MENVNDISVWKCIDQLSEKILWLVCLDSEKRTYTFGFGKPMKAINPNGRCINIPPVFIQARKLRIVHREDPTQEHILNCDTASTEFEDFFGELLCGLQVEGVNINMETYSLCVDLGDWRLIFMVEDNEETSWKYIMIEDHVDIYTRLTACKEGLMLNEHLRRMHIERENQENDIE